MNALCLHIWKKGVEGPDLLLLFDADACQYHSRSIQTDKVRQENEQSRIWMENKNIKSNRIEKPEKWMRLDGGIGIALIMN